MHRMVFWFWGVIIFNMYVCACISYSAFIFHVWMRFLVSWCSNTLTRVTNSDRARRRSCSEAKENGKCSSLSSSNLMNGRRQEGEKLSFHFVSLLRLLASVHCTGLISFFSLSFRHSRLEGSFHSAVVTSLVHIFVYVLASNDRWNGTVRTTMNVPICHRRLALRSAALMTSLYRPERARQQQKTLTEWIAKIEARTN